MSKDVTIIGAGLVGSLCALYMVKRGYKVNVYDRRQDLRSEIITAGKSINLALSERGWTSLRKVGIEDEVMKIAIPVYKRIMHDEKGILTEQPYGKKEECIYSVSRAEMNILMMNIAEKHGANLFFNEKCIDTDLETSTAIFENLITNKNNSVKSDLLIGSDGAFSAVRKDMVKKHMHDYQYTELDHDYKELLITSVENGSYLFRTRTHS